METKEILKQLRESKGFTIQDVAKKIGMQYTMCREYETGSRNLGMSAAMKFADFYDVSLDYLMGRTTVKRMATEETDPFANIDVAELEKRIIEKYTALSEEMRAFCIDLFRQQTGVIITENGEVQHESPRSDIQLSQNFIKAIARSKSNPFREAPTPEQIASLTPVPEDSDL